MTGRKKASQPAGLPAPGTRQRPISNLSVAPVKGPNGQLGVGLSVHFEGGAAPLTGVLQLDQARQLGELLITTARIAAGAPTPPKLRAGATRPAFAGEPWPSDNSGIFIRDVSAENLEVSRAEFEAWSASGSPQPAKQWITSYRALRPGAAPPAPSHVEKPCLNCGQEITKGEHVPPWTGTRCPEVKS